MKSNPQELPKTTWDRLSFPRLCGLLAEHPTRLSLSMHNAGYNRLNLPFTYVAFNTVETASGIQAMRSLGMRGLSLTIPHKEAALPLVDTLSADARKIAAINTVVNDGFRLHGFNTDWFGIVEAFREANIAARDSKVLIFGAGGAARAAIFAFQSLNAAEITVANRTIDRAKSIATDFAVKSIALSAISKENLGGFEILVNATPMGSHLTESAEVPISLRGVQFKKPPVVFDMVTRETPWLAEGREIGARTISGTRMLLHQALEQFRLFTEVSPPIADMEQALTIALQSNSNVSPATRLDS